MKHGSNRMPNDDQLVRMARDFKEDPNIALHERRCALARALADWMETQPQQVHEEIYIIAQRAGFDRAGIQKELEADDEGR